MKYFSLQKLTLLTLFVISLSLMLSSCGTISAGENPTETSASLSQAHSGTQGVEAKFIANYPPYKIYDVNDFIALIEVENKGSYDLDSSDCYLQITGFDSDIIRGVDYIQSCGDIDGKSVYNLDGGYNQIEYESSNIDLPNGMYEYSPNLNLVWCYNYQTVASPTVCVDPLLYQVTSEQKSCNPQGVSLGSGQGGPVGVSYVGVEMTGDTAIFEISVNNYGGGRVLSPYADIVNCGEATLEYSDMDHLNYYVEMTGGSLIKCTPSDWELRLNNEAGKIICSFDIDGSSAFETPLLITLDYGYIDNVQKSVQIIETP